MIIRSEKIQDYDLIHYVNFRAFKNREKEARLVENIRDSDNFIPELSLVAELDGKVVGHILFSIIHVVNKDGAIPILTLAPMAVLPEFPKKGIGSTLVREGLRKCAELGHTIVVVMGHPEFYPKFGFTSARAKGLECEQFQVPDSVFMVYELQQDVMKNISGVVQYPESFIHV